MGSALHYRLVARIAETDAGETWRGVASGGTGGPRPALIKILTARVAVPEVVRVLIDRVARTHRISHPSLIVPWEVGTVEDRLVLTSPYVDGHDLGTVFARLRSREIALPVGRAVHIMAEAANGIAALHQAGVVHGSLGPSDVFITFDGGVRVACPSVRLALEAGRETRHLALRGRKAYRAPEMARTGSVDALCDVYALGALAYELTTAKSIDSSGPRGTSTRSDQLPPPSRADRRIPMKLDPAVMKALETARTRRHKDAEVMRDALWNYLDTMGEVVTPAEVAEFASTLLPNEVVQWVFDPEEAASGPVPLGGSFAVTPLDPARPEAPRSYDFASVAPPEESIPPTDPVQLVPQTGEERAPTERTVKVALPDGPPTGPEPTPGPVAVPTEIVEAPALDMEPTPTPASPSVAPRGRSAAAAVAGHPGMLAEAPEAEPLPPLTPITHDTNVDAEPLPDISPETDPTPAPLHLPTRIDPRTPTYSGPVQTVRPTATVAQRPIAARPSRWWWAAGGAVLLLVVLAFAVGRIYRSIDETGTAPDDPAEVALESPSMDSVRAALADAPDPLDAAAEPADASDADPEAVPTLDDEGDTLAVAELVDDDGGAEDGDEAEPAEPEPTAQKAGARTRAERRRAKARRAQRNRRAKAAEQGRLTIYASHRARVYIDGKNIKRFTPLKGYSLPAGTHTITLIHPQSGLTTKRRVRIEAGKLATVKMSLK